MEARSILMFIVALSALIGFALLAGLVLSFIANQSRVQVVRKRAVSGSAVERLLRNGIPWLLPFARMLLRIRQLRLFCKRLSFVASERGLSSGQEAIATLVCAAFLLFGLVGVVRGSLLFGMILAAGAMSVTGVLAAGNSEKRRERMREDLPDALRVMAACFHAGFTLPQTFAQLECETKGPLGRIFGQAAHSLNTGSTAHEALARMRQSSDVAELSFIALALEVQHQSGGSMQHVLDATGDLLKNELDLRRSLKVHTAQARLSARVVVAVTIGLVAVLMALTEDFLTPFFESVVGFGLLALAVGMQLAGIFLVRRLLRVEVG